MSEDARKSIALWLGTITLFGLFWAVLHCELGPPIPDSWLWPTFWCVVLLNGFITSVQFVRGLWKRRASNPANPILKSEGIPDKGCAALPRSPT